MLWNCIVTAKKTPRPCSVTAYPASMKWTSMSISRTADDTAEISRRHTQWNEKFPPSDAFQASTCPPRTAKNIQPHHTEFRSVCGKLGHFAEKCWLMYPGARNSVNSRPARGRSWSRGRYYRFVRTAKHGTIRRIYCFIINQLQQDQPIRPVEYNKFRTRLFVNREQLTESSVCTVLVKIY